MKGRQKTMSSEIESRSVIVATLFQSDLYLQYNFLKRSNFCLLFKNVDHFEVKIILQKNFTKGPKFSFLIPRSTNGLNFTEYCIDTTYEISINESKFMFINVKDSNLMTVFLVFVLLHLSSQQIIDFNCENETLKICCIQIIVAGETR